MLTQLVSLLENKGNGLSLSEISREMRAQPSAVLGMIRVLVQKGKILEIGPDNKCCTTCGFEAQCSLLAARGKRYVAASGCRLPTRKFCFDSISKCSQQKG
jgi:hypothetical protein